MQAWASVAWGEQGYVVEENCAIKTVIQKGNDGWIRFDSKVGPPILR
jgi:hypothetical protein